MSDHLSFQMQHALDMAKAAPGKRLHRWPGGYWAAHAWSKFGPRVPFEHVATQTVEAGVDRGLFEITKKLPRGQACQVRLVKSA